jgi:hypothetical protein
VTERAVLGKMIRSASPRTRVAGEWIDSVTFRARNRQPDEPPRDRRLEPTGRSIGREWTAGGDRVEHGRGAEHDAGDDQREDARTRPSHHPLELPAPRGVAAARSAAFVRCAAAFDLAVAADRIRCVSRRLGGAGGRSAAGARIVRVGLG